MTDTSKPGAAPDPTAPPAPATADHRRLRWIAAALAAAIATSVGAWAARPWWAASQARERVGELGAEWHDRPILAAELDTALEQRPTGAGAPRPTTLRAATAGGGPVILHFWASWCPPCIKELAGIAALAKAAQARGCQVVAVSSDDDWQAMEAAWAKGLGDKRTPPGAWLRDPLGQSGPPDRLLRTSFGTYKLPETWVIADGRVLARFVGDQDWRAPAVAQWLAALCPGS